MSNPDVRLGYNTNGFAHHALGDALQILSELGYRSVAITLEREHLDPPERTGVVSSVRLLKPLVAASGFSGQHQHNCGTDFPVGQDGLESPSHIPGMTSDDRCVTIETGARFILDPRRKHQPTLISARQEDRARRIEFLKAAIDVAASIKAESVSLWSGAADDDAGEEELFERLVASMRELLTHAEQNGVRLSFEPEPGMFIDTMASFQRLFDAIDHELFGLTLDVGHVHCLQDGDAADHIRRWRDVLWNVHIEDMREGKHEHLMFGEGTMEFAPIFEALREIDYLGPVHVELSRHSHNGVEVARKAYEFLSQFL